MTLPGTFRHTPGQATKEAPEVMEEEQLVALIDDGHALHPDVFSPPQVGPYQTWRANASAYVRRTFGSAEQRTFDAPHSPKEPAASAAEWREANLKSDLQKLRNLRDLRRLRQRGAPMSGGEFEYLCHAEALSGEQLSRMAEELDALAAKGIPGAQAAADQTRTYTPPASDAPIRNVWRAVEWWRSGDHHKEKAVAALADYLEENR